MNILRQAPLQFSKSVYNGRLDGRSWLRAVLGGCYQKLLKGGGWGLVVVLTLGLVAGCGQIAEKPTVNEPSSSVKLEQTPSSVQCDAATYRVGEVVVAVAEAIAVPTDPQSLDTIVRYGTDSRYYVVIRGWLYQELSGTQSQLNATRNPATKDRFQRKTDFLRDAIRRIDLE